MLKKVMGQLYPRQKYPGVSGGKYYFPKNRAEVQKVFGGASKVYLHFRVYDRSGTAPTLEVEASAGCFDGENPAEGPRVFIVSATAPTPTTPWNPTNMATLPDDGLLTYAPTMGLMDAAVKISGTGAVWVEFEAWYTAEYAG